MCNFGSCKTRFEFLSQFRKVRNAFQCFVTQVQTRLPKSKCVWPMKINVICTEVSLLLITTCLDPGLGRVRLNQFYYVLIFLLLRFVIVNCSYSQSL